MVLRAPDETGPQKGIDMAAMSRQDFELIAEVITGLFDSYGDRCDVYRNMIAEAFADELADTNPRFDRARFLKACGVQS